MSTPWSELDTPSLLIERSVMEANLLRMQALADESGVRLRPHIKTHKSPALAHRQLARGAAGIAVAKLAEAEAMVAAGITDIQIANQIVGTRKIERLLALAAKAHISCAVDAVENARDLSEAFATRSLSLELLIEVDSGMHRCGLAEFDSILQLAREIEHLDGVRLKGIMTHAGHAYGASGANELAAIGRAEGETMVRIADSLRKAGVTVGEVSVGSTPTARTAARVTGVTELRVGNYIFNDRTQVALGVARPDECALTVLTRVISHPTSGRVVIDAGSKSFSSDVGAHGRTIVTGYGVVQGCSARLVRLSEEHGVLEGEIADLPAGRLLRIVPNHACAAMNLADHVYLVEGDGVIEEIEITARGAVT